MKYREFAAEGWVEFPSFFESHGRDPEPLRMVVAEDFHQSHM